MDPTLSSVSMVHQSLVMSQYPMLAQLGQCFQLELAPGAEPSSQVRLFVFFLCSAQRSAMLLSSWISYGR